MPDVHSPAFAEIRAAIFALREEDRKSLLRLAGDRLAGEPPPSAATLAVIERILALPLDERGRALAWIRRYVTRWGQIPFMSSRRASESMRQG